ncbi:hypothetical protein SLV14_002775 [Streptomyces sp. Je 1-4]|uniref:hypothetical protein n=1 Tax=Streptomyces TaxID=1883 RepID=UPI0021DB230B|nr:MULTISPECIES: hypothetical protein [unclassified Streptomyces]UYB40183.1 hypothetical protein SLV14_002775 [Streptomyces sp. Je 1-4]UZQ36276.1 hypothetical protein SLV14N_002775 [Streptomyces sp. Je 1-4] [Streptomyces sp. Je 1-4 4N24]UZQ43694.1 hypothetical protein SLV14NA_002775 [Streptomyces sp. Je 1-4] [Streptomyces sp. Je 1-4 4N24_ara]
MGLYVEARIRAGIDEVWDRSQLPDRHQRWDLRFSEIDYLPCEPGEPQHFRYATRVLPLLTVDGTGVSAGERNRPDGTRTSALRFFSAHPLSLIEEGRGYWRYVPDGEELRFLTGYDYRPRWGRFGRVVDRLLFRPLMGWATAWSFDRLRLWCERGITPERSLRHALAELFARIAAVLVTAAVVPGAGAVGPVLAVAGAALLLPPRSVTPAARRCLRRPPERGGRSESAAAPSALLATLEKS